MAPIGRRACPMLSSPTTTVFKMSPFEASYGRKCRTPLMWLEVRERSFFHPESIEEAVENVAKVRENLKTAQSR